MMTRDMAVWLLTIFARPYSNRLYLPTTVLRDQLLTGRTPLEAFYRWMMCVAVDSMMTRTLLPISQWDVVGLPVSSQPFDADDCRIYLRLMVVGARVMQALGNTPPEIARPATVRFEVEGTRQRSVVRTEVSLDGQGPYFQTAASLVSSGTNAFRVRS